MKTQELRDKCRDYLMGVLPKDINAEDALEALGFGRNGIEDLAPGFEHLPDDAEESGIATDHTVVENQPAVSEVEILGIFKEHALTVTNMNNYNYILGKAAKAIVKRFQSLNVQGEGKYCACVGLPYGLTSVALCAKCKLIWKPVANLPPTSEEKGGWNWPKYSVDEVVEFYLHNSTTIVNGTICHIETNYSYHEGAPYHIYSILRPGCSRFLHIGELKIVTPPQEKGGGG